MRAVSSQASALARSLAAMHVSVSPGRPSASRRASTRPMAPRPAMATRVMMGSPVTIVSDTRLDGGVEYRQSASPRLTEKYGLGIGKGHPSRNVIDGEVRRTAARHTAMGPARRSDFVDHRARHLSHHLFELLQLREDLSSAQCFAHYGGCARSAAGHRGGTERRA